MFCQGGDKTFFITKQVFVQMKGYDERYVIMEEYDFLRRVKKAGMRFLIMPAEVKVSTRKYQGRSWLKVQIANLVVFNAWQWNLAQPEKLKDLYKKLLG
jgi:predicted glycosyltransferase involved in capsule biosynthesis